jgi:hypothetical protein
VPEKANLMLLVVDDRLWEVSAVGHEVDFARHRSFLDRLPEIEPVRLRRTNWKR